MMADYYWGVFINLIKEYGKDQLIHVIENHREVAKEQG